MEESIANIKAETEKIKGKGHGDDNRRKQILQDLESKLEATTNKTKYYEKKHRESLETVGSLKDGITQILEKIDSDPQLLKMVQTAGVTESNVMEILGAIEQKTNGMIEDYLGLDISEDEHMNTQNTLDDKEAEAAALGIGVGAGTLSALVPTPASILDDFSPDASDEDDDETPVNPIEQSNFSENNINDNNNNHKNDNK